MALAGAAIATVATGCGGSGEGSGGASGAVTLTVYNAQHERLMKEIVPGFTKQTGIKIKLRNGDDFEMANQLVQEGGASPADVFLTENSPAMSLVAGKGLFAPIDATTLEQVPAQFSPSDASWAGFAARATVMVFNRGKVDQGELPSSIVDLADAKWKGRIAFSPSGADFQAIVSAIVELKGEQVAKDWLQGLKANGKIYRGNNAVLKAVNSGQVDAGIIYHYYWYRDRAESGANSGHTELHYFGKQDPGAFVSVSGAGVLSSSKHPTEAQEFVRYLTGIDGQRRLAESYALEYPLNPAVSPSDALKPLAHLQPPSVEVSKLNGPRVIELMQQAGLL
jgi:iron(III) transport system substrate-binding protein